ncbi:phosphoadenylyl-sulfate reductase [Sphingosinicella ginsenosidimutans]|uniref:Adenosine 5'-phosphosulfate reductase n=1 Tax=Allosphingosinicella ginsenosidimutans TaxID=1176539 RepID=A0A5C6TW64_9SPHN|nr:phosphoadenylyl-sulfate reductase [Sphingosinicella ginsenosidimutans]TXC64161.1 phosphoadenylyl-sulfate reductase [Sphingosinicella ginsenosidimutans]
MSRLDPARIAGATPAERLASLRAATEGRIVFTTSFGLEDQVLTHLIATAGHDIEIATLDTGRLFPETYETWARTEARYGLRVRAFYPDRAALEAWVGAHGIDGFYESRAVRESCCAVRKVEPLGRALAGAAVWVTGLRAGQSAAREAVRLAAWDEARGLLKVAPLFDWTGAEVAGFAAREAVPVSALHAKGYPSIGCAPCTRAVAPGEDERAGRWWWEQGAKECGLHVGDDGRLVRRQAA